VNSDTDKHRETRETQELQLTSSHTECETSLQTSLTLFLSYMYKSTC